MTIKKGTRVCVRTTNGGETFGTLLSNYVPTFMVIISHPERGEVHIGGWRIASVTAA